jgi:hypothetical protein
MNETMKFPQFFCCFLKVKSTVMETLRGNTVNVTIANASTDTDLPEKDIAIRSKKTPNPHLSVALFVTFRDPFWPLLTRFGILILRYKVALYFKINEHIQTLERSF